MEALRQDPEIKMLQVAHDLRSPLTALEIIAARLKTLPPDERQLIIQAVGRIQEIVVGVLSSTPVGSVPALKKAWELGDLRALVEEKKIEYPEVQFQIEISAEGPFQSEVPRTQMNRVLSNLINNACEANCEKGVVRVSVRAGEKFCVEIEDQGLGIPCEIRSQLGGLGVSGKESPGLRRGIGLYSAFQFVHEVGGQLELTDRLERAGTCVRLDLTPTAKNRPAAAG